MMGGNLRPFLFVNNRRCIEMINVKETINKSVTIKDAYMDGKELLNDDGSKIDFYDLLQRTYKDGTQFTIKVSTKVENDINE